MTYSVRRVSTGLGAVQILSWGTTYYLPALLVTPVVNDTGWSQGYVMSAFSLALLAGGVASPLVGRRIQDGHGRRVMLVGPLLTAAGLFVLAMAPSRALFALGWMIIGVGMASSLYDAAFGTVGQMFGHRARTVMTNLTLMGGLASTLCWPLGAWLLTVSGWRGLCFGYAALQIAVVLPLTAAALRPTGGRLPEQKAELDLSRRPVRALPNGSGLSRETLVYSSLVVVAVTTAFIGVVLAVHILDLLQAKGMTLTAAVGIGAVMGPSQVVSRLAERLFGERIPPHGTLLISSALVAVGIAAMVLGGLPLIACLILYGAGNGLKSIARGTVPLVFYGPARLPSVLGQVARPYLIAQAVSPALAGWVLQVWGWEGLLQLLGAVAVVGLGPAVVLARVGRGVAVRPTGA